MDGFKNSTKTHYMKGGYAKGGDAKGAAKISKVMGEFKSGALHSGSKGGPKVTSKKQAVAIAMSEAGKAKPVKKAMGGAVDLNRGGVPREGVSTRPISKRTGKPATEAEMRQRQRDFGDMTDAEIKALLGRANRASAAEAGERVLIRRGPAGAGFSSEPMISRKTGGLAVMPRGKKC